MTQLEEKLQSERQPDSVFTSTLRRARETAVVATKVYGLEPVPIDDLREISCGTVDGRPLADLKIKYPGLLEKNARQMDDTFRWPGGESYREFRYRILRWLRPMISKHRGQRALIFTHAGVISQIIGTLNRSTPAQWELFRPGYASLTELHWDFTKPKIIRFNECLD